MLEVDPVDLEVVLPEEGDVDADIRNKIILLQLIKRLRDDVDAYEEAMSAGLEDKFSNIEAVHKNPNITDDKKIQLLIDSCEDLVLFKKQIIDVKAENIMTVRDLIIQNPKYHYLAYEYDPDKKFIGKLTVMRFSLLLVLFLFVIS